jgi:hypothetical protein
LLQHFIKKIFSLKTLKYVLITISAFLLLAIVGYFSLRNFVLKKALQKVQTGIENRTNLTFTANNARFTGTSTVEISGISLVPTEKDTLFTTDTVRVTIKLLPALFGRIRLANLQVANTTVYLRKDSLQTNYRGLLKPSPKKEKKENTGEDLSQRAFNQIKSLLRYLPDNVQVTNAKLTIKYNDSLQHITLNRLNFESGKFVADIEPQAGFGATNWTADGFFDKNKIKGEVNLYSPTGVNLYPAILFKSGIEFKKLHLQINQLDYKSKALVFEGSGEVDSLRLYNSKLATDTVVFGKTGGTLAMQINRSFITVEPTSVLKVNNILLSTFMQYPLGKDKQYALRLKMPSTPAQTFFNSLPQGMFNTFAGIQVKGNLSYLLDCSMDGNMPDSLKFESELKKDGFEIVKYGAENFARINGPFMHTVYENGAPFRSFIVGEENPNYTPSDQLSIHFKNAILTNEDPSFFYHHGFIPQSFRDAIVEVYKAGFKFVRGGSTISMQLVKNVYLERKKTIARKAEEALIVWLIENNHISSKERMFEVYTNIIELAPGIYGIGEGSAFYFNKRPADLTMAEAIYLSNIVPRPKGFKYGFEKDGTLKHWLIEKTNLVVRRMVQREWIPANDTLNFNPQVQLKGPAKNFIIPADSVLFDPNDTLDMGADVF